jgi:hypothetical protein
MSGEFLVVSGEGQAYGEADADEWLAQTGWRKLESRPLAGPASVIVAEAARSARAIDATTHHSPPNFPRSRPPTRSEVHPGREAQGKAPAYGSKYRRPAQQQGLCYSAIAICLRGPASR